MQAIFIRRKYWLAGAALILAAYTLAGFWLLPWLIKYQLPGIAKNELARQATVADVSFNPFTLRLEARDLRLAEADGAPFFGVGKLAVELQWRSIVKRAWSFAEIRVTAPSAQLTIAPDGKFNLAELLATLARRPPTPDTGLPRLIIRHFALEQGRVAMRDSQAGYADNFSPIDFSLTDFSTLPEHDGAHTFSARLERGGVLSWKGEASVNPIRGSGELRLQDAHLPALAVYLKSMTRATLAAGKLDLSLPYRFAYQDGKLDASLADASLALRDLALARAGASDAFVSMTRLDVKGINADLARREATLDAVSVDGGKLTVMRDKKGELDLAGLMVPAATPAVILPAAVPANAAAEAPWKAKIDRLELSKFKLAFEDQGTGIKVQVQDLAVKLDKLSSDLSQAVTFKAGLQLLEGGEASATGSLVPASGALKTDLRIRQIALAPLQPLLSQYLKLNIASGSVSAQGSLTSRSDGKSGASLRYVGGFDIANLALNEVDGKRFASWKNLGAEKLTASLAPNLLEIPVLRVVEPNATLIIENDRSLNAVRLLVTPAAAAASAVAAPPAASPAAAEAFPVRIQRLRLQNAKLDFTDLSLRPQFGAKIYELNGIINGLSTNATARSQIQLDGRVNEFGMARIRGSLNPFAPRENTDLNVVFKNVDMVSASPYTMKFAGYRIAEGKISLDLQYKVRDSRLEGANQIILDKLILGERIDSPDAMSLPLELAIAILKDSDGRIDLGIPVSGNMDDPQFSYGALVWKAIGNVLTRIVTAPFRALGSLFGGSGEELEAIVFDPGSERLLPPEREKLKQMAAILSKRPQLKLSVPGQYSEEADGAVLRTRAVRGELARRVGINIEAGERTGPLDLQDPKLRAALRSLYTERFGEAELAKEKKAVEEAAAVPAAPATAADPKSAAGQKPLAILQRVGKLVQGEPQVVDAGPYYRKLMSRLIQNQTLAPDAFTRLGAQRASAILAALKEEGLDPASVTTAAPEKISADVGKPVALKLGLAAK